MENTGNVLLTSIHGLVGQQHLISHSESGSSGRLLLSVRNKDQSHEILKSACCSNKGTQFQTKGSISDGALRVTYYDSQGFVSCNFIFHVVDPTYGILIFLVSLCTLNHRNVELWLQVENKHLFTQLQEIHPAGIKC